MLKCFDTTNKLKEDLKSVKVIWKILYVDWIKINMDEIPIKYHVHVACRRIFRGNREELIDCFSSYLWVNNVLYEKK